MSKNNNLHKAKTAKNDEFYTQLTDIEKELKHYKAHFKGKTIFCNCDDPKQSHFWKYFHLNFNHFGLKKLIATHFHETEPTYKIEYTGEDDNNCDIGVVTNLEANGDFRSPECIELLKEADIVVTNPPFSLFRPYIAQLIDYDKKFIIVGNPNAVTYKEFFPLLKDNKVWVGAKPWSQEMYFGIPDEQQEWLVKNKKEGSAYIIKDEEVLGRVATIWFTNLDIIKRHEFLDLIEKYSPEKYPKYDNYDAINVDKVLDIPVDYDGVMGVPITFLDKFCPEQFEILGMLQSSTEEQAGIPILRTYNDFKEMKQDMTYTGASGGKANGNPVMRGKSAKSNFLYNQITKEYVHSVYARIVIKKRG